MARYRRPMPQAKSQWGMCEKIDKWSKSAKALLPVLGYTSIKLGQPRSSPTGPTAGRCCSGPAVAFNGMPEVSRAVMFHFSRWLGALRAAGLLAVGFILGVAFFSLANSAPTLSLSRYIGTICAAVLRSSPTVEAPFISENVDAMKRMMVDMGIRPTGDVDRDFVTMMVPHHEGAIAMAIAVLRYGHNEQIKRLAQEIIVTQQQEIAAMRLAVGEPLPPPAPAPDQVPPAGQNQTASSSLTH